MNKKDLKATKDSQGYYEVTEFGCIVWDGYADSAKEAKESAIDLYNDRHYNDED